MLYWVVIYLLVGAVLGFISNVHMVNSGKSKGYKIMATLGLLFGWPLMIGYILILAFLLSGGLF